MVVFRSKQTPEPGCCRVRGQLLKPSTCVQCQDPRKRRRSRQKHTTGLWHPDTGGGRKPGQPAPPQGCLWTLGLQSSRLSHRKGCHVVRVTWAWGGPTPGACACRMAGRVPFRKKAGGLGGRPLTSRLPSRSRGCRSSSWGSAAPLRAAAPRTLPTLDSGRYCPGCWAASHPQARTSLRAAQWNAPQKALKSSRNRPSRCEVDTGPHVF